MRLLKAVKEVAYVPFQNLFSEVALRNKLVSSSPPRLE